MTHPNAWSAAMLCAIIVSGCGSSTSTSTRSGSTVPPTTVTTPGPDGSNTPVDGGVESVALSGSTAWAVVRPTATPSKPGIWAFEPGEDPAEVVPAADLGDAKQVAVAPTVDGFAVLIETCTEASPGGACARDAGSVQLRSVDGALTATVEVWADAEGDTEGGLPGYLGVDGDRLWVTRHDAALAIDKTGTIVETVPVDAADTQCLVDGVLTNTDIDDPNLDRGEHAPGPLDELAAATMTVTRWSDGAWHTPEGAATEVPGLAEVHCGDGGLTVWSAVGPAKAWSAVNGWRDVTTTDAPADVSNLRWSMSGAAYSLDDRGALHQVDPTTGATSATGLLFDLPEGETPVGFQVADSDTQVFACASRFVLDGVKGSPTDSGTTCGFAARPTP